MQWTANASPDDREQKSQREWTIISASEKDVRIEILARRAGYNETERWG
jgi:hypothetical protein